MIIPWGITFSNDYLIISIITFPLLSKHFVRKACYPLFYLSIVTHFEWLWAIPASSFSLCSLLFHAIKNNFILKFHITTFSHFWTKVSPISQSWSALNCHTVSGICNSVTHLSDRLTSPTNPLLFISVLQCISTFRHQQLWGVLFLSPFFIQNSYVAHMMLLLEGVPNILSLNMSEF